ncbi:MAG: hypothetical protein ACRDJ4_08670 [Actinomycetota bacterium]
MAKPKAKSLWKEPRRKRLGQGRIVKTAAQMKAEIVAERKAAERR